MPPRRHDSAETVVEAIIGEVGKRIVLALPVGLGKASHIANALFERAAADPTIDLTILTALTLEKPAGTNEMSRRFIEPVIERLFGGYPELAYARAMRDGKLPANIEVREFFLMAGAWLGVDYVQQHFVPTNYTHAARYASDAGVNVVAQLVSPGEESGSRYSLSCNSDITPELLSERAAGRARFIMVGQTNTELPYMFGQAEVDASEFSHVLTSAASEFALYAPPKQPVGPVDYAIGLNVARLVPDGGTLQIGIGSLGDAIAKALIVRHHDNETFAELLARLGPASPLDHTGGFETGLYGASEMLVDAFIELADAGVLRREVDGALVHAAFFLGPASLYRRLREMPARNRARFAMASVAYVNSLHGDEAGKRRARRDARFINNAMMVTALGAAISDALEDGRVVSGVGGQFNFVAQAFAMSDARSIIALPATRRRKGRTSSNIRWSYPHTTIPYHLRDVVVTEYGIADLRGRTDAEAIAAILEITDSRFQDEILDSAKTAGKIARDHRIAEPRRGNTPERIAEALEPARVAGILTPYPFGTDFTRTEQRLIPALRHLADARYSVREIGRLLAAGFGSPGDGESKECLDRMGLSVPNGLKHRLDRLLLKGALALAQDGRG